jgi:hypothetical protein
MATRSVEMTVSFLAWDTAANAAKTGDSGNFTTRWIKDGTASAPTNSVSEIDATNCPGVYKLTLTSTETDADIGTLAGKSSTASVSLIPTTIQFERLPNAAPGGNGGVPTVDASNHVAGSVTTDALVTTVDGVADGIATTLGTAGDGLTDLGGFSTAAKAEINAEADTALADYDAPTKTEMDSKFSTTDGLIGTVDTVVDGLATTLGTAGAGLTDLGGMGTTMKGQVNTEADNALADYDAPTKSELDSAFTEIKGATWSSSTDTLEQIVDRGDAAWVTATGFNTTTPPTASAISDAVWDELQSGHTTAGTFGYYLDAQVSSAAAPPTAAAIADAVWDELSSGHSVSGSYGKAIADGVTGWATATGFSTFDPAADTVANVTTVAALAEAAVTDIWSTYSVPESYASQGSAATAAQMLYAAQAMDQEKSISSTTVTCKKLDQSTTAATFTLDSSSSPTSITRAT